MDLSKLRKFSICDISDALVKYNINDGGYIPNLTLQSTDKTVIGRAYTVLYASKTDPRPEVKTSYIDNLPKDSVLVIGLTPELQMVHAPYVKPTNAMYGGLMSTRAQYLECQGSIILGRIRDLDEHRDLGFPVWSYGIGLTAPSVLKVIGINVDLQIKVPSLDDKEYDSLTIAAGDVIMADNNGVVRVKESKLQEIVDYIPKRVEADQNVARDIKQGQEAKKSQNYWRSKI